MRILLGNLMLLTGVCLVTSACTLDGVHRDQDYRDHRPQREGEYKEKYWDGPCKIEREQKRDGGYKEERECKGVGEGCYRHPRGDYEEKYQDGPCKIEREWKRDGTYKEKIDCKGGEKRGGEDRRDGRDRD
ncbi:MAG: hypothetical protein KBF24_05400 [Thiobacillaceae bacterium]|jgi:hypothetical protein|nr:hypothetical protein [Thiobacillaceae bacterium]MBP9915628.1 hypothetical protein [Thiobacillaceae bacterium]